ncbi:MAG: ABC transporter ATP-binding protein [Firmicutes bacterium]|nr:ABC transporter ATP-binding protein [Bacillota bacterium]
MTQQPLLSVQDLRTYFYTRKGVVKVLDGLSFDLMPGQIMGLVGETGSGKSVSGASVMRILKPPGMIVGGRVLLGGRDLVPLSEDLMARVRGTEIAMIFQNPRSALNPVLTVGRVLTQVLIHRRGLDRAAAHNEAIRLLTAVHISEPERRMKTYPHQLSGGMCQRVMIALALSCKPKLLIADEPTTGLDVTTQFQIIQLLKEMRNQTGTAQIIITHDLGMASELCDTIAVMYAGEIVEMAPVAEIFERPRHPYTIGLLKSRPRIGVRDELAVIPGNVPDALRRPSGCPFHPRCAYAVDRCKEGPPIQESIGQGHLVSCHRWEVTE